MARSLYSAPAVVTQVPRAGPAQIAKLVSCVACGYPMPSQPYWLDPVPACKGVIRRVDDHDEVAADGDDDAEKTEVAEVSIVLLFTGA